MQSGFEFQTLKMLDLCLHRVPRSAPPTQKQVDKLQPPHSQQKQEQFRPQFDH
jgi:hypothetical protein